MTTQPSGTSQNGVAFARQPLVQVQDAAGNPVAGVRSVTAAINSGGGVLNGTATMNTDASGLATFAGLSISGTVGDRTLVFSSSGLNPIVSGTVAITAGAPTQMAISQGNSQTATAGSAVAVAPRVLVRDVSNNPVAGVAVTFAVATGGGSVLPVAPVMTNASGLAAATSWTLGSVAGINTLTATAAPAGIIPNPVTFTATGVPGGAGGLSISTHQSSKSWM
jgi:adhesin/invasin